MCESDDSAERMATSLRDFTEVWGDQNPAAIADIYAPEFAGHGFPLGLTLNRSQYRRLVDAFHTAFPDGEMTVEELRADEEFVYADWTFTGTHTGSCWLVPSSGAAVTFSGGGRHYNRDGVVQEVWLDVEWRSFARQILSGYVQ